MEQEGVGGEEWDRLPFAVAYIACFIIQVYSIIGQEALENREFEFAENLFDLISIS